MLEHHDGGVIGGDNMEEVAPKSSAMEHHHVGGGPTICSAVAPAAVLPYTEDEPAQHACFFLRLAITT